MRCPSPYVGAKAAYPCGQCDACRRKRARVWAHRIMLEASQHAVSAFVTLTYDDKKFAGPGGGPRSLVPRDLQLWIKRLRKAYDGVGLRYFACGEYGERSERPHYHAALFGFPPCGGWIGKLGECPCPSCSVVRKTWGYGHVLVGTLEASSAAYIGGYVTKKLGEVELKGRCAPFSRMSLKPHGIGAGAIAAVLSAIQPLRNMGVRVSDAPVGLRHGSSVLPLGRYLRGRLREELFGDKACPVAYGEEELRLVREYAFSVGRSVKAVFKELAEGQARATRSRGSI